ncbi:TraI/MobA(P) family conjugative relaxase, partial [Roseospira visakhapatnamensis]
MIAHRIAKKSDVADDYTRLAEYIAAAPEQGEKLDRLWIANCDAGETPADLEPALAEIEAVRQKKPAVADKTYHLVVSFRAEDRPGLTGAALKDMARTYAEALGFGAHQYVAGTHINTDHFHMHIAINKVHPETLKVHTPYRDFKTLEQTSRALEQRYGLSVDRGRADRDQAPPLSPAARDFEAATWEESFQRWLQGHRDAVLKTVADSRTWPELHRDLLARHGVRLTARGAGLVFTDRAGGQAMKASALDRACAKAALERRLGPFQAATAERAAPDHNPGDDRDHDPDHNPNRDPAQGSGYRRKPLLRAPGVPRLWRAFRKGRADT